MGDPGIYTTGGTVQAGGGVYLRRAADDQLLAMCREGTFAFVLTARQMGKSSLMTRAVEHLATESVRSVVVDLNSLGKRLTPGQWYLGFLSEIEAQLELSTRVSGWWNARAELSTTHRLTRFFLDVLLPQVKERVVVFVDEIDTTLRLDFTDDFFASIRSLYNARAQHPDLHRLSFVLLGAAAPTDLIKDPTRTPFNLGRPVELSDFTREEALPLAAGLGLPAGQAEQVLDWVLRWTGGHPYLTQRICAEYAATSPKVVTPEAIASLVERLFLGDRSFEDNNLQFVRDMLIRRAPDVSEVLATYAQVVRGLRKVRDEEQSPPKAHLKLSGVVRREQDALVVRNPIYRQVFSPAWVREHAPFHWGRFVRQTSLTVAVAGFILLTPAFLLLWRQWRTVERASQEASAQLQSARAETQRQRAVAEQDRQSAREALSSAEAKLETVRRAAIASDAKARELDLARQDAEQLNEELRGQRDAVARDRASAAANLDEAQSVKLAHQAGPVRSVLGALLAAEGVRRRRTLLGVRTLAFQVEHMRKSVTALATTRPVDSVEFSPDGTRIATAEEGGKVCVWQSASGALEGCMGMSAAADEVFFNKSGGLLAAVSQERAKVWDVTRRTDSGLGEGTARSVSFSPDGTLTAMAMADGTSRVWDVSTGLPVSLHGRGSEDGPMVLGPRRDALTVGLDKQIRVWDLATAKLVARLPEERVPKLARFSPDGQIIATALGDTVRLWTAITIVRPELSCKGEIRSLRFSDKGRFLLATSPKQACLWTGTTEVTPPNGAPMRAVAISPGEDQLAIASPGNAVEVLTYPSWGPVAVLTHDQPVRAVAFSPDGKTVATGGERTTQIWDLDVSRPPSRLAYGGKVRSTWFTPDGAWVILREDGHVETWDPATSRRLGALDGVGTIQVLAGAKALGTVGKDGIACLRDAATGLTRSCSETSKGLSEIRFLPDGRVVGASRTDGTIGMAGPGTGRPELLYPAPGWVMDIAVSADGRLIASASNEGTVIVWDLLRRVAVARLWHPPKVNQARFSADGRLVATAGEDHTARIWDIATGMLIMEVVYRGSSIRDVLFVTETKFLAVVANEVSVWDSGTWSRLFSVSHESELLAARVSADGRALATTGVDGTIRVWDLSNGAILAWIRFAGATSATFSPDGESLSVMTEDGAQLIPWRSADLVETTCALLPRNLTADEWKTYVGNEPYQKTCPNLPGP